MDWFAIIEDLVKLLLQFAGATLIAWLTVRWALRRYKSEKTWERESAAILDLLAAIGEIEHLVGEWLEEEYTRERAVEEWSNYRRDRFRAARRELGGLAAMASVILPKDLAEEVRELVSVIDRAPEDDYYARQYELQLKQLETAREKVAVFGKARMRGR